jgi:hypothetical protein
MDARDMEREEVGDDFDNLMTRGEREGGENVVGYGVVSKGRGEMGLLREMPPKLSLF